MVEEGKCVFISTKLYVILRRHVPKLLFVSLYSEVPVAHTRFDLVAVSSSQCIQTLQLISALDSGVLLRINSGFTNTPPLPSHSVLSVEEAASLELQPLC